MKVFLLSSTLAGPLACCCGKLWCWGETRTRASLLNASLTCWRLATGWRDQRTAQKKCKLLFCPCTTLIADWGRTKWLTSSAKPFSSAGITSCSDAGNRSQTRGRHSQTLAKSWKRWWWKVGYGEDIKTHKLFIFFQEKEIMNQHLSVHYWHYCVPLPLPLLLGLQRVLKMYKETRTVRCCIVLSPPNFRYDSECESKK